MLDKIQKRKESGFTIVEVMIVLAIAGLLILVVFLAVPALQRNARNAERTNDVTLIAGAVNECLGNRNGQVTGCDAQTEIGAYVDSTKLRQLTGTMTVTNLAAGATAPTAPTALDVPAVYYRAKCSSDGATAVTTGVTARSAIVLYNTENNSGTNVTRCQEV